MPNFDDFPKRVSTSDLLKDFSDSFDGISAQGAIESPDGLSRNVPLSGNLDGLKRDVLSIRKSKTFDLDL